MKNIKLVNAQKPVLATLLGACMEDVNHELYGGIWSQMIFGEALAYVYLIKRLRLAHLSSAALL